MVAKVSIKEFPEEVREAIARGESVSVYDDDHLTATVVPEAAEAAIPEGFIDYREAMKGVPPLDDDFEKDIQETIAAVFKPQLSCGNSPRLFLAHRP